MKDIDGSQPIHHIIVGSCQLWEGQLTKSFIYRISDHLTRGNRDEMMLESHLLQPSGSGRYRTRSIIAVSLWCRRRLRGQRQRRVVTSEFLSYAWAARRPVCIARRLVCIARNRFALHGGRFALHCHLYHHNLSWRLAAIRSRSILICLCLPWTHPFRDLRYPAWLREGGASRGPQAH